MSSSARPSELGIKVINDGVADTKLSIHNFLPGDIVTQVDIYARHFPNGKQALFNELLRFHESQKSKVSITVKRGEHDLTRDAFILPRKNHDLVLVDYDTANVFTFEDYTLEECKRLQDEAQTDIHERLLSMRVASVDVQYTWEEGLSTSFECFNMVYSILVLPNTNAMSLLNNPEETASRAMTWFFKASTSSGVPLSLRNLQTEPLLTEASEQGSAVGLSSMGNIVTYGLHQAYGTADRIVVNAVRLWFEFEFAEFKVTLEAEQDEPLLGVSIGRTEEGFCYVREVVPKTAADRAGLKRRLEIAEAQERKLVVTRVCNEKVLPWLIANNTIKCYSVSSIIGMLKAYHQAHMLACLHILDIKSPAYSAFSHSAMHVPTNSATYDSIHIT